MKTDLNDLDFVKYLNAHLAAGGVIAFPTDTVWGLGALPTRAGAAALFEIKRRPHEKHLIIMSDSVAHIRPYMTGYPPRAFELANKYWPGALTIGVPVGGSDTFVFGGVRVPAYRPFQDLCAVVDGHCLATSSANISGMPPMQSAAEIRKTFPDIIVIDNAYQPMGGQPSTVVVLDGDKTTIARAGAVEIN
ncbi:L-threonylcarbamoyladenylate synthase [bacterium]|nr:L-threonylcarbamoyladenylate synthase [bacterium]